MNISVSRTSTDYSFLGLFSGSGGLDLGFELEGFNHTESNEILDCAVDTLRFNRPSWKVIHDDVHSYNPSKSISPDVVLAGFPCQGFSLGGHRFKADPRNHLYRQVIRIANKLRPRVIVMENVLNLRTMKHPETDLPFADQITKELKEIGYATKYQFFRVSYYGVPQTRRRFIFVAYREEDFGIFTYPEPSSNETTPYDFLYDLSRDLNIVLPNHNPAWGFKSVVHLETSESFNESDPTLPVRFSRTASDGTPLRSFDYPFPAMDTAPVWGWAQGNIICRREAKDRLNSKYIRNINADVTLWRIYASRLRSFTAREYARLQTFPDDWEFKGGNKRDFQLQIGNAVPVNFARCIAKRVLETLEFVDGKRSMKDYLFENFQHSLPL
ncbi:DNA (cytosine-5-)-methyltransferase [Cyanobium sp. BA20m-p-22]|uniref:DNA cytosine methyltransferase n=1 Tax=Cyanobium sp. BA20m-p-22 TaxID=2823704 RepID=UPI0020CCC7BE|nr:DNA (cytosine-5-)-methyltransferase [Cyanobium sp. BA20m-p-22]MCP9910795.1 DNA (cytosine-5-)-methyltransferase [Cyanobium sp. BA20m-p-22]